MAKSEPGSPGAPIGAPMVPPAPAAAIGAPVQARAPVPAPAAIGAVVQPLAAIGAPVPAPAAIGAPVPATALDPDDVPDPREQHIGSDEWWDYMQEQGITYDFGSFRTFGDKNIARRPRASSSSLQEGWVLEGGTITLLGGLGCFESG